MAKKKPNTNTPKPANVTTDERAARASKPKSEPGPSKAKSEPGRSSGVAG